MTSYRSGCYGGKLDKNKVFQDLFNGHFDDNLLHTEYGQPELLEC